MYTDDEKESLALDAALAAALRKRGERAFKYADDERRASIAEALQRIALHLDAGPIADTWGCTPTGHIVTMTERLGMVACEAHNLVEPEDDDRDERAIRDDLMTNLTELGANVLAMLVEQIEISRGIDPHRKRK